MPRIYTNFNSRPSARGDSFLLSLVRPSSTISIHAPPRGATTSKITSGGADVFQFTPLREGRLLKQVGLEARFLFQFTPLREGRRHSVRRRSKPARFQFTPLREGRLHLHRIILRRSLFQFTPLREGRPAVSVRRPCSMRISIHAPPRGATLYYPPFGVIQLISIHAPPRGATGRQGKSSFYRWISIHAPPRGATWQEMRAGNSTQHFNSRPSARGDGIGSRSRCNSWNISIHAPPRGATQHGRNSGQRNTISIHAPPRGATKQKRRRLRF